jgi:hypothetical protein
MNKKKLSLLMRGETVDGRAFEPLIEGIAPVAERYIDEKKGVASSVLRKRAPFLNPSPGNQLLRVVPQLEKVAQLVSIYLADNQTPRPNDRLLESGAAAGESTTPRPRVPLTAEEFEIQQERNSEVGQAGELLAVQDELERLRQFGCPEPKKFVSRVALSDVGRGYDIESTWPGHERCIEVKTSTKSGSDFFLTQNERRVLSELAQRAWLYRVLVQENGIGEVTARICDPMSRINNDELTPVLWRVRGSVFSEAAVQ